MYFALDAEPSRGLRTRPANAIPPLGELASPIGIDAISRQTPTAPALGSPSAVSSCIAIGKVPARGELGLAEATVSVHSDTRIELKGGPAARCDHLSPGCPTAIFTIDLATQHLINRL